MYTIIRYNPLNRNHDYLHLCPKTGVISRTS